MLQTKNVNNWLCSFPKLNFFKLLTDDARQTTDDDGQRPFATGLLSDSDDLKIQILLKKFPISLYRDFRLKLKRLSKNGHDMHAVFIRNKILRAIKD